MIKLQRLFSYKLIWCIYIININVYINIIYISYEKSFPSSQEKPIFETLSICHVIIHSRCRVSTKENTPVAKQM